MSLYEDAHVQTVVHRLFSSQTLNWWLIVNKFKSFAIMMLEVLVIGMRYYPLMSVMEEHKSSLVCTWLASVYMWADTIYNVATTGLCEGLKLNVNLDVLSGARRVFSAGFLLDLKSIAQNDETSRSFDAKLLFSSKRILYSIVKSLPHLLCLAYVTVRLTMAFVHTCVHKLRGKREKRLQVEKMYEFSKHQQFIYTSANISKR